MNAVCSRTDAAVQGKQLLWSTSTDTLRLAITETVNRCAAPAATTSAPAGQSRDDEQRVLLFSKRDAATRGGSKVEDWT